MFDKGGHSLKTYVYLLDLIDDPLQIEKYLLQHKNVWAQIPKKLKELGVLSNRIFRLKYRLVCVLTVADSFNPQIDLAKYTQDKVCKKWDDLMKQFQKKAPGARPDEWWALAEEIYSFDNQTSLS